MLLSIPAKECCAGILFGGVHPRGKKPSFDVWMNATKKRRILCFPRHESTLITHIAWIAGMPVALDANPMLD